MKPKVKICCISSVEEAQLAIRHGASALGLVGKMPSGPGMIEDSLILEIQESVPPPVSTFLLTSETNALEVINHHKKVRTSVIQLVDALENSEYHLIREHLPGIKLVQVIHVIDEDSVREAIESAPHVDALLLDSGNPKLAVKVLGGTGNIHDWNLSRTIRESVKIPVFLAGGLKVENVREAVEKVQPFGLDLCSSVRSNGKLDEKKLEAFFAELEKI
ncbi:phosphoribosylanthranilate isomerase [Chryseobacterium sp. Leaf201]|uniref:phosphoribosylanthranilate isomerase n=1 Tax=Chryseobacterium sp. Leaf201 TaxID=1735672 RepID=UPI0006FE54A7|nr:phosphoribosylanthranilate isomerase [Chryseobacterium sp. Leaf201]KQM57392.1 N-(5'-phosphoribosyl)anthranilate isomerase [Chryseobacterium sp. Leaf201]